MITSEPEQGPDVNTDLWYCKSVLILINKYECWVVT